MMKVWWTALFSALVFANPARAAVTYEFNALSGGYNNYGTFTVTLPGVPTSTNGIIGYEIPASQLTTCQAGSSGFGSIPAGAYPCAFQSFRNNDSRSSGSGDPYDIIVFGVDFFNQPDVHGGLFYYFNSGAFETAGHHATVLLGAQQAGTLNVYFSAVPEPATWALIILGFGAIGYAMRRQRSRRRSTVHYRVSYAG